MKKILLTLFLAFSAVALAQNANNVPAIPKGSATQFGLVKVDGKTITATAGVIASASTVVAGTTQTVTTAQWAGGTTFAVTTAAQTLTLPASSGLSVNGGLLIQTVGQSVTLTPNAADAINGGTTGASVTIGSGLSAYITTDGAGNIRATPTTNSGSGTVTSVVCGTGLSGGTITTSGTCALNLGNANIWTATQTFAGVNGGTNVQSGTTYTLVATDCGKTMVFTSATPVTVTIPSSIVPAVGTACAIAIFQSGAGQVAVNGAAVTAATLVSAHSYTKTFGQNAMIGLTLTTIGATTTAILSGDGA